MISDEERELRIAASQDVAMNRFFFWVVFLLSASIPLFCLLSERIRSSNEPRGRFIRRGLSKLANFYSQPRPMSVCLKQVQYWGGPDFTLSDGRYYCPEVQCNVIFTSRRGYSVTKESDMAIFHHLGNWNISDFESDRPPDLILAYMTRECPFLTHNTVDLEAFNWTISYRSSSDFPIPYGTMKRLAPSPLRRKNWASGKTKLVAWFGSNCNRTSWPRTEFVRNLSKFVDIDMYGLCGDLVCEERSCLEKIRSYKFYLALENHVCVDYVTEKMWRNAFYHDAVPVVYGTSRRNYEKLAPENSFIHVSDFDNMSSLASYLRLLDGDDRLYNSYFDWRNRWQVDTKRAFEVITIDKVCAMVKKLIHGCDSSTEDMDRYLDSCFDGTLPLPV